MQIMSRVVTQRNGQAFLIDGKLCEKKCLAYIIANSKIQTLYMYMQSIKREKTRLNQRDSV